VLALIIPLEQKKKDLALKVLEKVAAYETLLKKPACNNGNVSMEDTKRLAAQYYVLRTALVIPGPLFLDCV
jgi:hypothetical protein